MLWLLVFFLTPIAEMYLLIEVAGYIDVWPTIALVMLTAVIGVALLKRQGLATLTRGMTRLNAGQVPATEMAEGILLAVAGALLITPGFFTDGVGFTLLFPPSRQLIAHQLLKRMAAGGFQSTQTSFQFRSVHSEGRTQREQSANRTIEGEFERKSD